MEHLKQWVKNFIMKHYNDVDWVECDYGDKTKMDIMSEIDKKPDVMCGWILMEVLSWSMKDGEDWNKKLNLEIENPDDDYLIKLDGHFYMKDYDKNDKFGFRLKEVFPKTKTITYYE